MYSSYCYCQEKTLLTFVKVVYIVITTMILRLKRLRLSKPKIIVLAILLVVFLTGGYLLYREKFSSTRILDKFPVMLINNGKTAVYYQMKVARNSITNQIIVSNLTSEKQEGTKIYEDIPKEIVQSASELDFKPKPIVLEDDPIILWDLGPLDQGKSVELQYTPKKRYEQTLCTDKGYYSEMDKVGLNAMYPDDCDKFIEMRYQEALARNKKRREQELKDQVQLINPGEAQYQEIEKAAKKVISQTEKQTTRKGCSGSKEDVIAKIRAGYPEVTALPVYNNLAADCEGACNKSTSRWEIVCSRDPYKTEYMEHEFHFTFYVGDTNGNVRKTGNYVRSRSYDVVKKAWEDWKNYGQPQFGVK